MGQNKYVQNCRHGAWLYSGVLIRLGKYRTRTIRDVPLRTNVPIMVYNSCAAVKIAKRNVARVQNAILSKKIK